MIMYMYVFKPWNYVLLLYFSVMVIIMYVCHNYQNSNLLNVVCE